MTATNQIKAKLLELEGGVFQRLCDDWLHKKGYENINAIGMMQSTDRVTKGTPDCLIIRPDGYYVFTEYTVQHKRLALKLEDDINKCFDEKKTGIKNNQISEIIICYLGALNTHEISHLKGICEAINVRLTLNGLDTISLSIQNSYPILAEQYLSLSLDTGQLLSVNDFITRYGNNKVTTSIDNVILFQDEALELGKKQLELGGFLLVSGAAGVGKTLFSVNLVSAIEKQNPEMKVYCLFDKGVDLVRDITAHFSEPGDYLIFIDDANRLDNRLDYILHYLNEDDANRTFRIVATVRDYARDSVYNKVSQFTEVAEQIVKPLTDEQIKDLIVELYEIKNQDFQKRIQEIAKGNARLALMAADVAKRTQQIESIQNVTSLYDDYFNQNDSVKTVIENEQLMATACAISFFRKIDKSNESQMNWVLNSFGVQPESFWEFVDILHKHELVDLYENEVVKISDQVLSTYLFYLAVFENKTIPFSVIVRDFYPEFKRTIIDALNPVISAFDHKKIIKEIKNEIQDVFKSISDLTNPKESLEFLNSFWFAFPTETLLFVSKLISRLACKETVWEDEVYESAKNDGNEYSVVTLLCNFRHYDDAEFKMSFELLLKYLEKSNESLGYIIKGLVERYNFKANDWRYGFNVQIHVIDTIIEKMKGKNDYLYSKLFIILAEEYLKIEHSEQQWSGGDTINMITFRLSPNEYITPLRGKIIQNLSSLMLIKDHEGDALDVIKNHIGRLRFDGKDMLKADLPFFEKHLVKNLNGEEIAHCLIMQDLCEHLNDLEIDFPTTWENQFTNTALELSNFLIEDRSERKMLGMGYEEYNQHRFKFMVEYFSTITLEQFDCYMQECVKLHGALSGRERDYIFKNGLDMSLRAIAETHQEIYADIISTYIDYDDVFELPPNQVVSSLFKTMPHKSIWGLINSKDYRRKKLWCSFYFSSIPTESISTKEVGYLLIHFNSTPSYELTNWLDFLSKYRSVEVDIYPKVVRILLNKSIEDINYSRSLGHIFNRNSEVFDSWFEIFESDKSLIFDAYRAAFKVDSHFDYSGEALDILTTKKPDFLELVVDSIYERERWPSSHTNMPQLNFLWTRESFIEDIECYAISIYNKEKSSFRIHDSIFKKLFSKENDKANNIELTNKKHDFIKSTIIKNINDIKYVCFIFDVANKMSEDFRLEILNLFIHENGNFEDFKSVEYELTTTGWTGSRVPILEREKNYLIKVLPMLNYIEFLEHKDHVEKQIEYKIEAIEFEKKRDFLESRH
jgi:hypothetical protein